MLPLTEKTIRGAFVNASRKELSDLVVPDLGAVDWDALDYLGWRDGKNPRRAFVVVPVASSTGSDALDSVAGVALRQAEASPRSRAQCSWCQDVALPFDVVFFSARRAGADGRNGNTVGTLVCSKFECSATVRKTPPEAYLGYDVEAARAARIAALQQRAAGFVGAVLHGA